MCTVNSRKSVLSERHLRLSHHNQCATITDSAQDRLSKLPRDTGWVCIDCKTLARSLPVRIQSSVAPLAADVTSPQTQVNSLDSCVDEHARNCFDRNAPIAVSAEVP
jgi:hypothetical protein